MPVLAVALASAVAEAAGSVRGALEAIHEALLDASTARVVVAGVAIFTAVAVLGDCHVKAFWYDEIVTVDVASLRPLEHQWAALKDGADSQPVGYYLILRAATAFPLDPHLTHRLPSLLGYLLTLASVYAIVGRRLGPTPALLGALLVALSPLRFAATEARPYALVVGFVALSALIWQRVDHLRTGSLLLAGALAVAAGAHHLGIVAACCLALAELAVVGVERRLRWSVWAALAVGTLPFFVSLPLLLSFDARFGAHFWSASSPDALPLTYTTLATLRGAPLVWVVAMVAVLAACVRAGLGPAREEEGDAPSGAIFGFTVAEAVMIASLALYPLWIVVPTWLAGSAYVARYASPVTVGLAAAGAIVLARLLERRMVTAVVCALLSVFVFQEIGSAAKLVLPIPRWTSLDLLPPVVREADLDLPVAIASGLDYLPMAYYASPEEGARYHQLVDPEAAVRLMGSDTVEWANIQLAKYVPLQVVAADTFLAEHQRFYVYASRSEFAWLPLYLQERGFRLTLQSTDAFGTTWLVEG